MATRADIRDAFETELVSIATQTHTVTFGDGSTVTTTVDSSNIDLISPNKIEERPAIAFDEDYNRRLYNGVGTGPHGKSYDQNGDVTVEIWREYMTATFFVRIEADNEIEKEPIYEAVRSGFGKYNLGAWDETDLHADITDIRVEDGQSVDYTEEDDPIRVDDLTIEIDWYRDYDLTDENIDVVDLQTDADNDGTVEDTYTIN